MLLLVLYIRSEYGDAILNSSNEKLFDLELIFLLVLDDPLLFVFNADLNPRFKLLLLLSYFFFLLLVLL